MAQFQFVMRSGPLIGKVYPLEAQEITIGRDASNMIAISDPEISRRHARMELRGSAYVIQDLGSTNGTFVNGMRVGGIQPLNPGDSVAFGEGIVLVYESAMDANATVVSANAPRTVIQRPISVPPAPAPVQRPVPAAPAPTPVQRPVQVPPTPVPAPVQRPTAAPVFSGQVPASPVPLGPVSMPPAATPKKKKIPMWLIILIILLVITCACVSFFLVIDKFSLWCKVVPFLVPLLGGTC
jgi:predicted component of type VI protein secretion system